jgi:hypothetical protein
MVEGAIVPHRVSPGSFNLNNISPQIGKNLGTIGTLLISKIQNPEIAEERFLTNLLSHFTTSFLYR